ncbi:uncharacterized protein LOC114163675 [Vigna unguiculata]|uniref:uncharacterized protein LOC114163675 n=1 Tax=Vigna unguiculata TaxID=3917 RepID=UPI00101602A4|nr:uncharacterized protein LOC114163675 [Vigna unguiculata]
MELSSFRPEDVVGSCSWLRCWRWWLVDTERVLVASKFSHVHTSLTLTHCLSVYAPHPPTQSLPPRTLSLRFPALATSPLATAKHTGHPSLTVSLFALPTHPPNLSLRALSLSDFHCLPWLRRRWPPRNTQATTSSSLTIPASLLLHLDIHHGVRYLEKTASTTTAKTAEPPSDCDWQTIPTATTTAKTNHHDPFCES